MTEAVHAHAARRKSTLPLPFLPAATPGATVGPNPEDAQKPNA